MITFLTNISVYKTGDACIQVGLILGITSMNMQASSFNLVFIDVLFK